MDKKGNPDAESIGDIEYVNTKDGKFGFTIVENIKSPIGVLRVTPVNVISSLPLMACSAFQDLPLIKY